MEFGVYQVITTYIILLLTLQNKSLFSRKKSDSPNSGFLDVSSHSELCDDEIRKTMCLYKRAKYWPLIDNFSKTSVSPVN